MVKGAPSHHLHLTSLPVEEDEAVVEVVTTGLVNLEFWDVCDVYKLQYFFYIRSFLHIGLFLFTNAIICCSHASKKRGKSGGTCLSEAKTKSLSLN